jgi:4'-phosphopantetheinyl transferase
MVCIKTYNFAVEIVDEKLINRQIQSKLSRIRPMEKTVKITTSPSVLHLPSDEVHIWSTSIETALTDLEGLKHVLSEEEKNRAERFCFDQDRTRHIVAHGVLRIILSYYSGGDPSEQKFTQNEFGKPALAENCDLRFNISHSGDQVLYGITKDREIGVDIEEIRTVENADQIVERFFSPHERIAFLALPANMKDEAFFTIWTRKEAYIKAQGQGLSLPLDQFTISFLPEEPVRLIETEHNKDEQQRWSMHEVSVHPEYLAAVAVKGHDVTLYHYHWSN